MKGTTTKKVGNISINCMSPESRDLLDLLSRRFKEEQGLDVSEVTGYRALYWACRYSRLIQQRKDGI